MLNVHYGFDTAIMSAIEVAESDDKLVDVIVQQLGVSREYVSVPCAKAVRDVVSFVGNRAAKLSACSIAAIIQQTDGLKDVEEYHVGGDGSVFQYYPRFQQNMKETLIAILGPEAEKVQISMSEDGSGVGAALIALKGGVQIRSSRPTSPVN